MLTNLYLFHRYLSTGVEIPLMAFSSGISLDHISCIIRDELKSICEKLMTICLPKLTKADLT